MEKNKQHFLVRNREGVEWFVTITLCLHFLCIEVGMSGWALLYFYLETVGVIMLCGSGYQERKNRKGEE
jgi:hypothetical protein